MANPPPIEETKIGRVFSALIEGDRLVRFDAERQLHDHCLPSTISAIQQQYSVKVSREYVTVPGYLGKPTRCCEYWIELEERIRYECLRASISKQTCPKTSDQTNENGFQMNDADDNSDINYPPNWM
ncbi:MAG: hypothetical protein GQ475_00055 [Methylococcaceae bacterium]|nr:hypothetical protein [Methylococcaceae bacterium]